MVLLWRVLYGIGSTTKTSKGELWPRDRVSVVSTGFGLSVARRVPSLLHVSLCVTAARTVSRMFQACEILNCHIPSLAPRRIAQSSAPVFQCLLQTRM